MEKIVPKGVVYAFLSMLFLQQFSSRVGATDVIFYSDSTQCQGSGFSFNSIPSNLCLIANGGSVLFTSTGGTVLSRVYRGGACGTLASSYTGGAVCFVGGSFTGAIWLPSSRRRSLLEDSCDSQTKPTGIVYTEDSTKGHWMLTSSDAEELYSQMQKIPDAEKANWFQSHGGSYEEVAVNQLAVHTEGV